MVNNNKLGILITVFISLIIGVILLSTTADQVSTTSELNTVINDTFIGTNNTCVDITPGCIDSIIVISNGTASSDDVPATEYSLCRSVSGGAQDGIQGAFNGANAGGTLNATYTYNAGCNYVANGTSRTLINLITIFFAIGIFAIGTMLFNKIKEGEF